MDARVNDFLSEIDEIAPLNDNKDDYGENSWNFCVFISFKYCLLVWEKCYDEESGFDYYWNTKTNEVTWDMPPEYKSHNKPKTKKTNNLYIPPRTAPLFPSTSSLLPPVSDAIKIYKIGECTDPIGTTSKKEKNVKKVVHTSKKDKVKSKPFKSNSDSDDE